VLKLTTQTLTLRSSTDYQSQAMTIVSTHPKGFAIHTMGIYNVIIAAITI